jgi:hypothetical protein
MNYKKAAKLRKKIDRLRQKGGIKPRDLESLAKSLGKTLHGRKGSEPTWVDIEHSQIRPLSIPHHNTDLNKYTAQAVLDRLETDLDLLESLFKQDGKER